jgi:hypothetical protein
MRRKCGCFVEFFEKISKYVMKEVCCFDVVNIKHYYSFEVYIYSYSAVSILCI